MTGTQNLWQDPFLRALRLSGNIKLSCQAAGVGRAWIYKYKNSHPAFAAQWEDAEADAIDVLEAEARRRALTTSDLLLIFLLKARKPEMYRERYDVRVDTNAQPAQHLHLHGENLAQEFAEYVEARRIGMAGQYRVVAGSVAGGGEANDSPPNAGDDPVRGEGLPGLAIVSVEGTGPARS